MQAFKNLRVKIFVDEADLKQIQEMNDKDWVSGFTTNPTLMRKTGVKDYAAFAKEVLKVVASKPISFEVFADNFDEMQDQACEIASWGANVYVKIPIMNTRGQLSDGLIHRLLKAGIPVNVTAVFNLEQVKIVMENTFEKTPCVISVFAGRIADTGRDPCEIMQRAAMEVKKKKNVQLLWASPREMLNLFQANDTGCDIVTMPVNLLKKADLIGKDLEDFSKETVDMFYQDAKMAHYKIECTKKCKIG